MTLREEADKIIEKSIHAVLPDTAVTRALENKEFGEGRLVLVSIGKAGWQMAKAAVDCLGDRITDGIVITKYDHVKAPIANLEMVEAGHPVPDENSFLGTQKAIDLVSDLTEKDTVLFLISGGGSALFEKPLIPAEDLTKLTKDLLASGADITEMNTIRKRMSAVKGGKFAELCKPASVYSIVLSDIIGDPLDMIASGPAYPDSSTKEDAKHIVEHYKLNLTDEMKELLEVETPKSLDNVETVINGSVRELCVAAKAACEELGYEAQVLTDCLCCEASDAGSFLASIAATHQNTSRSLAFIAGGETVVHLKGKGLGGRNQELALAGALPLSAMKDTALFSVGSDGTDGPTDAAGGYVDSETVGNGISAAEVQASLADNDAYHALQKSNGLIMTGATGTNVNDVAVLLIKR
ncbi:MAG: DUF4147 domain-containing protein [Lachnospiraceae bacterium]|nr:DUF4147 domain-containing protein [Lachnospiraceae bacterium]